MFAFHYRKGHFIGPDDDALVEDPANASPPISLSVFGADGLIKPTKAPPPSPSSFGTSPSRRSCTRDGKTLDEFCLQGVFPASFFMSAPEMPVRPQLSLRIKRPRTTSVSVPSSSTQKPSSGNSPASLNAQLPTPLSPIDTLLQPAINSSLPAVFSAHSHTLHSAVDYLSSPPSSPSNDPCHSHIIQESGGSKYLTIPEVKSPTVPIPKFVPGRQIIEVCIVRARPTPFLKTSRPARYRSSSLSSLSSMLSNPSSSQVSVAPRTNPERLTRHASSSPHHTNIHEPPLSPASRLPPSNRPRRRPPGPRRVPSTHSAPPAKGLRGRPGPYRVSPANARSSTRLRHNSLSSSDSELESEDPFRGLRGSMRLALTKSKQEVATKPRQARKVAQTMRILSSDEEKENVAPEVDEGEQCSKRRRIDVDESSAEDSNMIVDPSPPSQARAGVEPSLSVPGPLSIPPTPLAGDDSMDDHIVETSLDMVTDPPPCSPVLAFEQSNVAVEPSPPALQHLLPSTYGSTNDDTVKSSNMLVDSSPSSPALAMEQSNAFVEPSLPSLDLAPQKMPLEDHLVVVGQSPPPSSCLELPWLKTLGSTNDHCAESSTIVIDLPPPSSNLFPHPLPPLARRPARRAPLPPTFRRSSRLSRQKTSTSTDIPRSSPILPRPIKATPTTITTNHPSSLNSAPFGTFSSAKRHRLLQHFLENDFPSLELRRKMAEEVGLTLKQVSNFFIRTKSDALQVSMGKTPHSGSIMRILAEMGWIPDHLGKRNRGGVEGAEEEYNEMEGAGVDYMHQDFSVSALDFDGPRDAAHALISLAVSDTFHEPRSRNISATTSIDSTFTRVGSQSNDLFNSRIKEEIDDHVPASLVGETSASTQVSEVPTAVNRIPDSDAFLMASIAFYNRRVSANWSASESLSPVPAPPTTLQSLFSDSTGPHDIGVGAHALPDMSDFDTSHDQLSYPSNNLVFNSSTSSIDAVAYPFADPAVAQRRGSYDSNMLTSTRSFSFLPIRHAISAQPSLPQSHLYPAHAQHKPPTHPQPYGHPTVAQPKWHPYSHCHKHNVRTLSLSSATAPTTNNAPLSPSTFPTLPVSSSLPTTKTMGGIPGPLPRSSSWVPSALNARHHNTHALLPLHAPRPKPFARPSILDYPF